MYVERIQNWNTLDFSSSFLRKQWKINEIILMKIQMITEYQN